MARRNRRHGSAAPFLLSFIVGLCALMTPAAYAEWETAVRGGYSSNVDHSIRDPQGDSYVTGNLTYVKGISGESRLNWTFDASVEGTGYLRNEDLSYGEITLAPALVYFLRHNWTVSISPFVQGKAVADSDQSAVTLGGRISMREQVNPAIYLSQFYLYRASTASSSVYSAWEHVMGAVMGTQWTKRFFSEVGYEYAHGDAFRSVDNSGGGHQGGSSGGGSGSGQGKMRGRRGMFSSSFDALVFREIVDRHAVGMTIGYDWTKSLFSTAGYTYSVTNGSSGTSYNHAGFASLGYRF